MSIVAHRRDSCWRRFTVGVCDQEVARNAGAQQWEGLGRGRFVSVGVGWDLLDTCGGRLHNCRILHDVGVDVVYAHIIPSAYRVDL